MACDRNRVIEATLVATAEGLGGWRPPARISRPRSGLGSPLEPSNLCSIASAAVRRFTNEHIEQWRRSLVLLKPGQPSGLSREEAVEILEELQRCRSRGRHLLDALREVAAVVDRALRALSGIGANR